eukprot:Polyplicarium_translucidae@DN5478_c0_g1_i1.p1
MIRRATLDPQPYIDVITRIDNEIPRDERGDVLIFLSGANEIQELKTALHDEFSSTRRWIFLQLHSQIPSDQQERVFDIAPDGVRKCILSTNIAETSLTINGIRFVVDSGKVKEMDVDLSSAIRHLQERWESQSSANQRAGRAGRTGPGHCYRLFSQNLMDQFEPYSTPELMRSPLDVVLLQVMAIGHSVETFGFVEPPTVEAFSAALHQLILSKAVVL